MINGVHHRTFQEAAIAIGLFEDCSEAMQYIEEAIAMGTSPSAMRFLFVQILLNLPCSAAALFERYKEWKKMKMATPHQTFVPDGYQVSTYGHPPMGFRIAITSCYKDTKNKVFPIIM